MQKERASKRPVGSAGAITDNLPRHRTAPEASGVLTEAWRHPADGYGRSDRRSGCERRAGQEEAELATGTADEPNRRDFIVIAAQAFAGVGAALALWPFIQQMNPDASTQALASIEVDVSPVKEGQAITVSWRGKPVFVRHRTAEEVRAAKEVKVAELVDRSARNDALPESTPATDLNRTKKGKENWIILVGICTHLGCIPKGQSLNDSRGDFGGWFCPCHGSHYDTAGRIRRGPAPRNLEVPIYEFVSDSKIKIG
jgi:ubiquinol-cytochrome c reductase iron-sulfur subunit